MKLIVGLGNPGKEYENTRHNIGFLVLDNYINQKKIGDFKSKNNGLYLKTKLFDEDVIFLKPQSYINLSGEVIRKYVDFYKINIDDILIINDDLDLEIGNYKLKASGSSGGHNGLKNIEANLKTNKYKRLKIGISNRKDLDTKDYVLGRISKEEANKINDVKNKSIDIIDDYFNIDFSKLMNKYNQKNRWHYEYIWKYD